MKRWTIPAFFVLAIATGNHIATESWNGRVYVYLGEQRAPATVRSIRDYSAVDRKALTSSVNKQLLASAKLKELNGYIGVTLGHPLFKRAKGTGEFACPVQGRPGVFDKVELTFFGTGVSEAGDPPLMIVEGECAPGGNLNEMRTIWIPMKAIMASAARDQEMQLFGDQPVTVRLQQIPGQWPESWVLQSVRLFREHNPDDSLVLDSKMVREANPQRLSIAWRAPANQ